MFLDITVGLYIICNVLHIPGTSINRAMRIFGASSREAACLDQVCLYVCNLCPGQSAVSGMHGMCSALIGTVLRYHSVYMQSKIPA